MQLTGVPGQPLSRAFGVGDLDIDGRAAARVPGCVLVSADIEPDAADPADRPGRLDRVGPGCRAALALPAVEFLLAGQHRPDAQRLIGQGGIW